MAVTRLRGLRRVHAHGCVPGRLIDSGLTNAEIAERLFLSSKTVSNNVSVIFDKLQVAGRPKAIVQARNAGLGRTEIVDLDPPDHDLSQPPG